MVGCYALRGPGFLNPVDMAFGRGGIIYVASRGHSEGYEDLFQKRITLCNVAGDYLGNFATGGTADGDLMWPSAIAIDSEDNLYVADELLQRISVLDSKGRFLAKWGVKGTGEGEFDRPAGLAFDNEQNLLVVDGLNNRVQRYTKDGRYLGGWGKQGQGNGQFDIPWGISVDHLGNAYVADWRNDRIQKFDPDGKHLATWGSSGHGDGQFNRPSGVAVDREGYVYVADRANERVQVLDQRGRFVAKFRGQSGFSKWAQNWFNIANQDLKAHWDAANLEPQLDPAYSDQLKYESGSIIKLFWGPTAVRIDARGNICVLETSRHRIQVYVKGS
jgi:DNA-binding beta-propeller fold protein YncE